MAKRESIMRSLVLLYRKSILYDCYPVMLLMLFSVFWIVMLSMFLIVIVFIE